MSATDDGRLTPEEAREWARALVSRPIHIRNDGGGTLLVTAATDNRCIKVEPTSLSLGPGEEGDFSVAPAEEILCSGVVPARISDGYAVFGATVILSSNGGTKRIPVEVRVKLIPRIRVAESSVDFGASWLGEHTQEATVQVSNKGSIQAGEVRLEEWPDWVEPELNSATISPGETVHWRIKLQPKRAGKFSGTLVFAWEFRRCEIPVQAQILRPLEVEPRQLDLGRVRQWGTGRPVRLRVANPNGSPVDLHVYGQEWLRFTGVTGSEFRCTLGPHCSLEVRVRAKPEGLPVGPYEAQVSIYAYPELDSRCKLELFIPTSVKVEPELPWLKWLRAATVGGIGAIAARILLVQCPTWAKIGMLIVALATVFLLAFRDRSRDRGFQVTPLEYAACVTGILAALVFLCWFLAMNLELHARQICYGGQWPGIVWVWAGVWIGVFCQALRFVTRGGSPVRFSRLFALGAPILAVGGVLVASAVAAATIAHSVPQGRVLATWSTSSQIPALDLTPAAIHVTTLMKPSEAVRFRETGVATRQIPPAKHPRSIPCRYRLARRTLKVLSRLTLHPDCLDSEGNLLPDELRFDPVSQVLYRVQPNGGKVLWQRRRGKGVSITACTINADRAFAVWEYRVLEALALKDGRRLWEWRAEGGIDSFIVTNDYVVVREFPAEVYCLVSSNGTCLWKVKYELRELRATLLVADLLFIRHGPRGSVLSCFDVGSGRLLWQRCVSRCVPILLFPTDGSPGARRGLQAPPNWELLLEGHSYDHRICGINARTGSVLWAKDMPYLRPLCAPLWNRVMPYMPSGFPQAYTRVASGGRLVLLHLGKTNILLLHEIDPATGVTTKIAQLKLGLLFKSGLLFAPEAVADEREVYMNALDWDWRSDAPPVHTLYALDF